MPFCTDTDLLYWEPSLFQDATAAAAAQTLLTGTATLDGTTATFSGVSLTDARVRPLDVIQFSGTAVTGAFPVVSVDSDTQLTLSVLYDGLFPADGSAAAPARAAAIASGQSFAIRTFFPHRQVVSQLLLQAAGLDPADPDAEPGVVNPDALKRPCVLGTLQMIYNALAATAAEPTKLSNRADLYERLYRRALRSARVEIDTDGDGAADVVRSLGAIELLRR